MATIKFHGLDAYTSHLNSLEASSSAIVEETVYAGASITADEVRRALRVIPTSKHDGKDWIGTPEHPARGPSRKQKIALLDSLGITPISTDHKGFVNVNIGFDGYNDIVTKRWPKGQPNRMVVRAVVSGTSFMQANPFIKIAVSRSRRKAQNAMKRAAAEKIRKEFWARRSR